MKNNYRNILFILLLNAFTMFSSNIVLAEGKIVDPRITPSMTLVCTNAITRTDSSELAIGDISTVEFYVSTSITNPVWELADTDNTSACRQVYDLTQIADGQYYYAAKTVDLDLRKSVFSSEGIPSEYFALVVKRIADPSHPTGLTATFN